MVDARLVDSDQSEVTLNLADGRITAPIANIAVVIADTCAGDPPWENIERARRCAGFRWAAPDLAAGLSSQTDPVDVVLARVIGDAAKGGTATLRLSDGSVVTGTVTVASGLPFLRVQTEESSDLLLDPKKIDEMEVHGWSKGDTTAVVLSLVAVGLITSAAAGFVFSTDRW